MMRVLVTGGLGFIGSNFIIYLSKKYPKIKITNLDAQLPGSNIRNLEKKNKNYKFFKSNINNRSVLDKLVSNSDIVINFAAESHVDRSIHNPKPFIDSNVLGVFSVLESIKKHKKKLIQISTDEVFGSLKQGSAKENFRLNPSSPYSASKASAELLINSYIVTYDCNAIITRCTNNFGPRQSPEKLIPKIILRASQNMKIPIYGTGKNVRDWIYVFDHCEAITKVMFKGKRGQSYNISSGEQIDNLTLVKKILKIMEKPSELIQMVKDRPGHDYRYSLDSRKIYHELKWKSSYNFEESLKETIDWYLMNDDWIKYALRNIKL